MKNTLLLVSLTLASGILLPAVIHADSPVPKTKRTNKVAASSPAAAKAAADKQHETTYIAKTAATGSHIPTVWRSYDGRMDTPSNLRVYSQNDLSRSGELDVAAELTLTDPSITTSHGR
jgi:hypothetical protein